MKELQFSCVLKQQIRNKETYQQSRNEDKSEEIQGSALVSSEKEEVKFDSVLLIKMRDALIAQG